jgi:hypothetical protein
VRQTLIVVMAFSALLLSACAKSGGSMNYAAGSAETKPDASDSVKRTLQDYINHQHGESSPDEANDIMNWVTNKDLSKIPLVKRTIYKAEENNLELDRVQQNLHLQSRTDINHDSYLMMRGKVTSLDQVDDQKKFEQGISTVCQVSKSTVKTIHPTNFKLIRAEVSHEAEFNMIDIQWSENSGASVFTRCLSRQTFTLGDLRAALQGQFVISIR